MHWKYLFNWQPQQFVKKMHVQIENALEKVLRSHLLQRPGRSDKETLILDPTILLNLATMPLFNIYFQEPGNSNSQKNENLQ